MHIARPCPACQSPLPPDAPGGLCPRCLMQLAAGAASQPQSAARTSSFASARRAGFTPPSVSELAEHFPQLEIMELLGRGGMGAVYKARQPGLDRLVALKILPPDAADATFERRFAQEARALARLNHPHIVTVYDSGVVDGLYYFVMEYIAGVNLREAIRDHQLEPRQALAIVGQVCEALQYAHDQGVVHRDIKPENILLDQRGRVKIADFGLAKLLAHDDDDASLTGTHQVMGTPKYMAPEQLEGTKLVDHRADIYSLGVVFYELLTGELPLGRFAPPSKHATIDTRLDDVVLRALEKEPSERYQHASEVKSEVDAIAADPAPLPKAPQPNAPPKNVVAPSGSVTVALQQWPRSLGDFGTWLASILVIALLYWLLPAALAYGLLLLQGEHGKAAIIKAAAGGLVFMIGPWALLLATSIRSVTCDARGIVLRRFAGPSEHFTWDEIEGLSMLSRGQVLQYAWLWPGLLPRSSVVSRASWPFFAIHTQARGDWYFCPGKIDRFLSALAHYAPPTLTIPATGEAYLDDPIVEQRRNAGQYGSLQPAAAAASSRRPWLVPLLAIINLLLAVICLLSSFLEDPFLTNQSGELYRAYSFVLSAASYVTSAMLLAGSIGMLMWKSWGRWLTLAVWIYVLVVYVVETPLVVTHMIPAAFTELKADIAADGSAPEVSEFVAGTLILLAVIFFTVTSLGWSIGQMVYLTRPRVVAAFDALSPAWAAVQAPLLTWTALFTMICFSLLALYLSPLGPRIESRNTIELRPRYSEYDSLWLMIDMVETPLLSPTAIETEAWEASLRFEPKMKSSEPLLPPTWLLKVQMPSLEASWQQQDDVFERQKSTLNATKLAELLRRDMQLTLGVSERMELEALVQLLQEWRTERPQSVDAFRQHARARLGQAFEIGEITPQFRHVRGFSLEMLTLAIVASSVLYCAGIGVWGAIGGQLVHASEKPDDRARAELDCFGGVLLLTSLLVLTGAVVLTPLLMTYVDSHHRRDADTVVVLTGVWSFLAGIVLFFSGIRTRSSRGSLAPWIGSAACLIPLSPLVVLTLPVGVWGLWLLSRRDMHHTLYSGVYDRGALPPREPAYRRDESLPYQLGTLIGWVLHSRRSPAIGAMLLGLVAVGTPWLAWVEVVEVVDTMHAEVLNRPLRRERFTGGYDIGGGIAVIGAVLCLALFAAGPVRRPQILRALLLAIAGVFMLVVLFGYWIRSQAFIYFERPYDSRLQSLPLFGLWLTLAVAVGLLAMAAWELRRAVAARENSPPSKLDGLRSEGSSAA